MKRYNKNAVKGIYEILIAFYLTILIGLFGIVILDLIKFLRDFANSGIVTRQELIGILFVSTIIAYSVTKIVGDHIFNQLEEDEHGAKNNNMDGQASKES